MFWVFRYSCQRMYQLLINAARKTNIVECFSTAAVTVYELTQRGKCLPRVSVWGDMKGAASVFGDRALRGNEVWRKAIAIVFRKYWKLVWQLWNLMESFWVLANSEADSSRGNRKAYSGSAVSARVQSGRGWHIGQIPIDVHCVCGKETCQPDSTCWVMTI